MSMYIILKKMLFQYTKIRSPSLLAQLTGSYPFFRLKYQLHFDISAEMYAYKLYFILNRTLIIQPLLKLLSLDHNAAPAIQNPFRARIILYQTSHFLISNMEIYRCFFNCHQIFFIKCNA